MQLLTLASLQTNGHWMLARLKEYGDLREILRMYFKVYVVATEFRRKMLATAAPHFSGISFLTAVHQKNSNERANKRGT